MKPSPVWLVDEVHQQLALGIRVLKDVREQDGPVVDPGPLVGKALVRGGDLVLLTVAARSQATIQHDQYHCRSHEDDVILYLEILLIKNFLLLRGPVMHLAALLEGYVCF